MRTPVLFLSFALVSLFVFACKDNKPADKEAQAENFDSLDTDLIELPGDQPDIAVGNWRLAEMVINAELSADEQQDVEKHKTVQLEHQKLKLHKDGTYDFEFPSSVSEELKVNKASGRWSISDDNTVFYINADPNADFVDKYEIVQLDEQTFVYNDTLDLARPTLTYEREQEQPQLQ
ncbi:MAG: DUF5004 domain-containing protein [Bacteroidota bacterium]